MNEKNVGEELIQLMRQIIRDEIRQIISDKVECSTKGQIVSSNTDGTFDVYVLEADCVVKSVRNESGHTLSNKDYVKVYYTQGNYANGYIGYKF